MKNRGCSARGLFASLAVVVVLLTASSLAASTDYTVLLDLDNNAATGCTVATTAGSFAGAEQRLITTVSNTSPLMVISVVRQVCVAGPSTWGPSIPVTSPYAAPWPVGEHQGTGGLDVIETYFPLAGVPNGFYRLGVTSSAGAGDALITSNGGAMIVSNLSIGQVPALGTWALMALAIALIVVAFVAIRAPHALSAFLVVALLVTAGAGVAWASLVPDGNPSGWSGIAPLGIRTPLPTVGSSNIAAVFGTVATDTLLLRIDADVPRSPSVTTQPVDFTATAGSTATFASAASGSPSPTVQWQVSGDGGASFSDIPGATNATLTFTATAADHLKQYHAIFTNIAGSATSSAATLTVVTLPVVNQQPSDATVAAGTNASFTSTATSTVAPTVQWQVSTDGGVSFNDIPGATGTTLTFTASAADHLSKYRAVFTNAAGSVTSDPATLSVATLPTVSTQPNNNSLATGGTATFTAAATSTVAPAIRWQVSTDGVTWTDVPGATSTTLSFVTALSDDLARYHAVFTNAAGSVTSNTAYLFVATTIGTPTLPHIDDFSVTDGGHLSLSAGWITRSGDFAVPGGAVGTATAAATPQLNFATLNIGSVLNSDQSVNVGALSDGQFVAFVARYSGSDMYYAGVRRTGSSYTAEVWKKSGGADTLMGSQTVASAPTDIEFQVNNASLKLLVNGAPLVQLIDNNPLGSGAIGFLATPGVVLLKNYTA